MKRLMIPVLTLALALGVVTAEGARASTRYADWQKVESIRYYANADSYLVSFVGGPADTTEVDANNVACESFSFMVINAGTDGVDTTQEQVDRLIQALEIARATGLRVSAWVHQCSTGQGTVTLPKGYIVFTAP